MGNVVGKPFLSSDTIRAAIVCVAFSLTFISTWLLNSTAYPGFNDFFPEARDIATTFGAVAAAGLAFAAMFRQRLFAGRTFLVGFLAAMLMGDVMMLAGVCLRSAVLSSAGACLRSVGAYVGTVYAGLALVGYSARRCLAVLASAFLLKYVWMGALWFVPVAVKWAALMVLPMVGTLVLIPLVRPALDCIARAESPADLAVTNPLSFLPFTNCMFVTILMFAAALGFVITYAAQDSNPTPFIYAGVPVACVMLGLLVRRYVSADVLYGVAYVLVLAGLLLVAVAPAGSLMAGAVANALLNGGNDVFYFVIWFMVARIGARNLVATVPVLMAQGIASSLGTELGALSGHLVNGIGAADPVLVPTVVAAIVLVFASYNFFSGRTFSFDRTLLGVEPYRQVVVGGVPAAGEAPADVSGSGAADADGEPPADGGPAGSPVDRACAELAAGRGLTPRESQVLGLLARGRNVAYIQEELTLSRNTVKSYVASVYGKLGVHSHQEVIDLVEGKGA